MMLEAIDDWMYGAGRWVQRLFWREIPEGQPLPFGYGFVRWNLTRPGTMCAPVPLNLALALLAWVVRGVRWTWPRALASPVPVWRRGRWVEELLRVERRVYEIEKALDHNPKGLRGEVEDVLRWVRLELPIIRRLEEQVTALEAMIAPLVKDRERELSAVADQVAGLAEGGPFAEPMAQEYGTEQESDAKPERGPEAKRLPHSVQAAERAIAAGHAFRPGPDARFCGECGIRRHRHA